MNEIVTELAVLARLPESGPTRLRWHWFWFRWMWNWLRGKPPHFGLRILMHARTRIANAEYVAYGPLEIVRPKPWLLGPARQLHPEAFQQEQQQP